MAHIKIQFHPLSQPQREILIAQLADAGFNGFEEGHDLLAAYIDGSLFSEDILKQVLVPVGTTITREIMEEKNWNEEWEKNFEPVIVHDFCAIRTSFHAPVGGIAHDILITPKMSFGTGHHATTYMMIEAMQTLDFRGKQVLDFGTGTGVLAILAEKLGAGKITAIDNDPWSIDNAAENIRVNNCLGISLHQADQLIMPDKYDIILANINKYVILFSLTSITQHLSSRGVLLLSGLLTGDRAEIVNKALENGLKLRDEKENSRWIMLAFNYR